MNGSPWFALVVLALLAAAPLLLRRVKAASPDGVRVVARTALNRNAVVAVLAIGDRRVLVGAGDQGVQLLADLDPAAVAEPAEGVTALAASDPRAWAPDTTDTATTTSTCTTTTSTEGRTDAVVVTTSATSDMAAALAALHADADAISPIGPGTGLVDRLRAMTVRSTPQPPLRGLAGVGRLARVPLARR